MASNNPTRRKRNILTRTRNQTPAFPSMLLTNSRKKKKKETNKQINKTKTKRKTKVEIKIKVGEKRGFSFRTVLARAPTPRAAPASRNLPIAPYLPLPAQLASGETRQKSGSRPRVRRVLRGRTKKTHTVLLMRADFARSMTIGRPTVPFR